MTLFTLEDRTRAVKNAADIVDIVSEVVLLKKAGKDYAGLCPFHSEKTPSFTVSPEKQIFHCFGCGTGGDVFEFLMKYEGISFPEVVQRLARRYGIEIPDRSLSPDQKRKIRETEQLFSANHQAMEFFAEMLLRHPAGKKAVQYLENRGFTKETVSRFKVGFAPDGWDNLVRYFVKKKLPLQTATRAGLLVAGKNGGFYDRFRNRIVFPIVDLGGRITGFGGRVLDDAKPKYLNSPETPIYNKSRSLYGLPMAKPEIRKTQTALIVEGYLDVLSLWQYGVPNAVAALGTSLTPEHVKMLKGHARNVILVFDSDEAGLKAARRSIAVLNKDVEPRILVLPDGHDPDSFLREAGRERFTAAAEKAMGTMDFLIDSAVNRHGLSVEGKVNIINDLQLSLAEIEDSVKRSLYVQVIAERIGVEERAILEKVRRVHAQQQGGHQRAAKRPTRSQSPQKSVPLSMGEHRMERQILAMMLQYPAMIDRIRNENILNFFENKTFKEIGERILGHTAAQRTSISALMDQFPDQRIKELISRLSFKKEDWNDKGCIRLLSQFMSRHKNQKNSLLLQIKEAEAKNDFQTLTRLLHEKQQEAVRRKKVPNESAGGEYL